MPACLSHLDSLSKKSSRRGQEYIIFKIKWNDCRKCSSCVPKILNTFSVTQQLKYIHKSLRTNRCGECESVSAAVWQIQSTSHAGRSFNRLWSRRKIQINYTSFSKKLLRFPVWNILLKWKKEKLKRPLSWLQKAVFSLKTVFVLLPSDPYFASVSKSGSKIVKKKKNSDRKSQKPNPTKWPE